MPVNLEAPVRDALRPVPGVDIGTTMAGMRKAKRRDLLVLRLPAGASAAGVSLSTGTAPSPVDTSQDPVTLQGATPTPGAARPFES